MSQKVLQYFGNMTHNLAAMEAFAEVVKMMKQTGLWDAGFAENNLWIVFFLNNFVSPNVSLFLLQAWIFFKYCTSFVF